MVNSRPKTTAMTPIDDDTLQRFYDGDLTPLEEHRVQAQIESDPSAQERLARLGQLTEVLRVGADQLAAEVDSAALFARIEARLGEQEQVGFGARLRLVAAEWLEHRRAALVPLATASAVAAATLLLVLRPSDQRGLDPGASEGDRAPELAAEPSTAELTAAPATPIPPGSHVENVDFGSSTGTVFELEDRGAPIAVVWITDDEEGP